MERNWPPYHNMPKAQEVASLTRQSPMSGSDAGTTLLLLYIVIHLQHFHQGCGPATQEICSRTTNCCESFHSSFGQPLVNTSALRHQIYSCSYKNSTTTSVTNKVETERNKLQTNSPYQTSGSYEEKEMDRNNREIQYRANLHWETPQVYEL